MLDSKKRPKLKRLTPNKSLLIILVVIALTLDKMILWVYFKDEKSCYGYFQEIISLKVDFLHQNILTYSSNTKTRLRWYLVVSTSIFCSTKALTKSFAALGDKPLIACTSLMVTTGFLKSWCKNSIPGFERLPIRRIRSFSMDAFKSVIFFNVVTEFSAVWITPVRKNLSHCPRLFLVRTNVRLS